jgi:hypothetical protein
MARRGVSTMLERPVSSWENLRPKSASDAYFNDWKYFCFALREIAAGANGRAPSGLVAQKRAQAVLSERGYTWPGSSAVADCSKKC